MDAIIPGVYSAGFPPSTEFILAIQVLLVLGIQILLALVGWLGKRALDRIERTQADLMEEVRVTNGTVIRVEQKLDDHDRLDEQRFDELEKRLDREERRR